MNQFINRFLAVLAIAVFLPACGSSSPPPPPEPPPDTSLEWDQGNWDEENWQ